MVRCSKLQGFDRKPPLPTVWATLPKEGNWTARAVIVDIIFCTRKEKAS